MNRAAILVVCAMPAMLGAQEDPAALPDFDSCMAREVAHFERQSDALARVPDLLPFAVGGTTGVAWCGGIGIVRCDRGTDPIPCQLALAERQKALAAEVLASVPPPDAVMAQEGLGRTLYPRLYALAAGSSAGADCAGAEPAFGAWCTAWAANDALAVTVHLWELGRYLGVAEDAVRAGWAEPPPLTRPKARP